MLSKNIVGSLNYSKFISLRFGFCKVASKHTERYDKLKQKHTTQFRKQFLSAEGPSSYPKNLSDYKRTLNELSPNELRIKTTIASEDPKDHIKRIFSATHDDEVNVISEGKVKVFYKEFLENGENKRSWEHSMYYNPATVLNRDISLQVVQNFAETLREQKKDEFKGIRVLDGIPNSGIFAMRILKELDGSLVRHVDVCERDENALNLLLRNFELNSINAEKAKIIYDDPNRLMFEQGLKKHHGDSDFFKYDVIDLDAQGSSITYIDAAIKAIAEGGLIGATFTDLTTLSSSGNAKCFYTYNSLRTKVPHFQEHAIRIVLYTINTIANRYGRYIKPVISYSPDFYQKVFFTVHTSKSESNQAISKYSNVYYCDTCTNYHVEKLGSVKKSTFTPSPVKPEHAKCDQCDSPVEVHGPIWSEQLNDLEVIQKILTQLETPSPKLDLSTNKKIHAMLHTMLEEKWTGNYPLGISMDNIASFFKVTAPSLDVLHTQVRKNKYSITRSYIQKNLWKTNAPISFYFELVKEWKKAKAKFDETDYLNEIEPGSPAHISFNKPPQKYNFDFQKLFKRPAASKVPLFFNNPEKNWGPVKRPTVESKS